MQLKNMISTNRTGNYIMSFISDKDEVLVVRTDNFKYFANDIFINKYIAKAFLWFNDLFFEVFVNPRFYNI